MFSGASLLKLPEIFRRSPPDDDAVLLIRGAAEVLALLPADLSGDSGAAARYQERAQALLEEAERVRSPGRLRAERAAAQDAEALARFSLEFRLAQTARDILLLAQGLRTDLKNFSAPLDDGAKKVLSGAGALAALLEEALSDASPDRARGRQALEEARAQAGAALAGEQALLADSWKPGPVVPALKKREIHRWAWRMTDALRRCLPDIERLFQQVPFK